MPRISLGYCSGIMTPAAARLISLTSTTRFSLLPTSYNFADTHLGLGHKTCIYRGAPGAQVSQQGCPQTSPSIFFGPTHRPYRHGVGRDREGPQAAIPQFASVEMYQATSDVRFVGPSWPMVSAQRTATRHSRMHLGETDLIRSESFLRISHNRVPI